jgi:hypothetical protein
MQAGAYVAVAHPYWYNLTETDALSLGPVHAIEIFNGTSLDHSDRPDSWYMLEMLSERGYRYTACATDDAHFNPNRHDAGLGWVWVKSESLTSESLLQALKDGYYYSSTGPEIFDIEVTQNTVHVRCSPAERIFVTGRGYHARTAWGNGIIEGEFDITNMNSPYLRITVRDAQGGRAWSNPIWL